MKVHYFNQNEADNDDILLKLSIKQGYVPETCLLGGETIILTVHEGNDPCNGCNCNRVKCKGREY